MTSAFSWQTSISLCLASFHIPRPNLPVTPGISLFPPTFAFQSPIMKRISFLVLVLLLLLSHFSGVQLCATPETSAHQIPPSLDSPGKNTGVGCHFLLQCMKVKSESEVASCLTRSNSMDCSLPGSSTHGIFQARVLEWGAVAFSGVSPRRS